MNIETERKKNREKRKKIRKRKKKVKERTKQKKMNKGTILVMFYAYQETRETIRFLFIRY